MILGGLNWQGAAGLAACALFIGIAGAAKLDARHWAKQSAQFERLYRAEVALHGEDILNFRTAADAARAADRAERDRVRAEQVAISERTKNDFESRLADARARAERLHASRSSEAAPGDGGKSPVPGLSTAAGSTAQTTGQSRLSDADALIATEQAIQLDELISWARRQAGVAVSGDR